jgi:hypothetical protein
VLREVRAGYAERTSSEPAHTPGGRQVTVIRA